jgi:hypothetical protein
MASYMLVFIPSFFRLGAAAVHLGKIGSFMSFDTGNILDKVKTIGETLVFLRTHFVQLFASPV